MVDELMTGENYNLLVAIPASTVGIKIDAVAIDPESKFELIPITAPLSAEDVINARYNFQRFTPLWEEIEETECGEDEELVFLDVPVTTIYAVLTYKTINGEEKSEFRMVDIMKARTFFLECVPDGDDYGVRYVLTPKGRESLEK